MSRHKKTTLSTQKHPSQDAVEQYIFGKASDSGRHRVERQLVEDGLLSDAVEGLSTQPSARHMAANMNDLKARLQQRIAQQKQKRSGRVMLFGMQPYAIAASVALVLACAVVVLFNTRYFEKARSAGTAVRQEKTVPLATAEAPPTVLQQEEVTPPPVGDESDQIPTPQNNIASRQKLKDTPLPSSEIVLAPVTKPASAVAIRTSPDKITAVSPKVAPQSDAIDKPAVLREKMAADSPETVRNTAQVKATRKVQAEANMRTTPTPAPGQTKKIIKGRVVDAEDGLAIPGAVVTVKGTSISTYTDQNGEYSIAVPNDGELAFSFIGYITYRIPVDQKSSIEARLTPDVKSLGEVVVIGADQKNTTAFKPAQPESGMPEFVKIIEQKLESSPYAERAGTGMVRLSFTVQPDGSLTNVKVLNSLCPECDQAAVQALQEASRWQPAIENGKPVPQKMKIRVPFRTKKK